MSFEITKELIQEIQQLIDELKIELGEDIVEDENIFKSISEIDNLLKKKDLSSMLCW